MDRSERTGLGISIVAHAAVFAALTLTFMKTPPQEPPKAIPIDISLAETVGLESAAPEVSHEELAAKKSPVEAPVEPESAPAPAPDPQPEPKPQPVPPKPAPQPQPNPKPAPAKPQPKPAEKPQPAKPAKPSPAAKPSPQKPSTTPAQSAATGSSRRPVKPTGNLVGLDIGKSNNKTNSTSIKNPGAKASAAEVAGFVGLITRQIQPCADRQVTPGPGAERIRVVVQLNFKPDGSLASEPQITDVQGSDAANSRYVARVKDLAMATFKGCTPIRGLPADLYAVPSGWKSLALRYKLPG